MGRPKSKEAKQQYTVMLKPSLVKEIDKMADELGFTRSQFMGNLIDAGFGEAKVMNDSGFVKLYLLGDKMATKIKKAFYSGDLGFLKEEEDK